MLNRRELLESAIVATSALVVPNASEKGKIPYRKASYTEFTVQDNSLRLPAHKTVDSCNGWSAFCIQPDGEPVDTRAILVFFGDCGLPPHGFTSQSNRCVQIHEHYIGISNVVGEPSHGIARVINGVLEL